MSAPKVDISPNTISIEPLMSVTLPEKLLVSGVTWSGIVLAEAPCEL